MTAAPTSRDAARAALEWLVASGADVLSADRPQPWLAADAPATTLPPRASPEQPADARVLRVSGIAKAAEDSAPLAAAAEAARSIDALLATARAHAGPAALLFDGAIGEAPLFVIGAPSASDLREGRLLSGPAGALFDRMLRSIGLTRATVGVAAAAVRPSGDEGEAALVKRLIALARPCAVVTLGSLATARLTGDTRGLNRLHGKWIEAVTPGYTTRVMPMLDPDHLLNHPHHKTIAWADLLLFKRELGA